MRSAFKYLGGGKHNQASSIPDNHQIQQIENNEGKE